MENVGIKTNCNYCNDLNMYLCIYVYIFPEIELVYVLK